MNIVDSSGWLAYFADEPNAEHFLTPLNDTASLVVPTVTIYEVFKVVLRESGENEALQAAVAMRKGTVVDLTAALAVAASKLSLEHNLPMADSIILATAKEVKATIWTQDSDFKNMTGVKYFPKR
ncbi:MAG: VapC toxin family PIN domain ribonuclease [Deltaproteobacteria bacterium]|nr:type II toxin-antitoxin system VapC family toxin [Deltaproteobacteria bacterium]MBW2311534.1 type II toxin-antitoxin system VapC family toxin [Deltaproteobacteria bacterium]RLB28897.1 MAG: VapC toxin family PIN domain ribonuclease [Deltaproteobacteria bacterium]